MQCTDDIFGSSMAPPRLPRDSLKPETLRRYEWQARAAKGAPKLKTGPKRRAFNSLQPEGKRSRRRAYVRALLQAVGNCFSCVRKYEKKKALQMAEQLTRWIDSQDWEAPHD